MFSVIFPGQGSQIVGMGKEFYDKFELVKKLFNEADETLNFSLSKFILEGPKEKLVGVEMQGTPINKVPEHFWNVYNDDNKKVGRLSRCFFSPRLEKNIGLAIVDINYAIPETRVIVESPSERHSSIVVDLPWYESVKKNILD